MGLWVGEAWPQPLEQGGGGVMVLGHVTLLSSACTSGRDRHLTAQCCSNSPEGFQRGVVSPLLGGPDAALSMGITNQLPTPEQRRVGTELGPCPWCQA